MRIAGPAAAALLSSACRRHSYAILVMWFSLNATHPGLAAPPWGSRTTKSCPRTRPRQPPFARTSSRWAKGVGIPHLHHAETHLSWPDHVLDPTVGSWGLYPLTGFSDWSCDRRVGYNDIKLHFLENKDAGEPTTRAHPFVRWTAPNCTVVHMSHQRGSGPVTQRGEKRSTSGDPVLLVTGPKSEL